VLIQIGGGRQSGYADAVVSSTGTARYLAVSLQDRLAIPSHSQWSSNDHGTCCHARPSMRKPREVLARDRGYRRAIITFGVQPRKVGQCCEARSTPLTRSRSPAIGAMAAGAFLRGTDGSGCRFCDFQRACPPITKSRDAPQSEDSNIGVAALKVWVNMILPSPRRRLTCCDPHLSSAPTCWFFVAGAGSGKTQSLAGAWWSAVASGRCRVDEVAAVTFTRRQRRIARPLPSGLERHIGLERDSSAL